MKKSINYLAALILMAFTSFSALAQDGKALDVNVDIDKGGDGMQGWMTNPLFWIIGALILVILIAVIARGGGNRNA